MAEEIVYTWDNAKALLANLWVESTVHPREPQRLWDRANRLPGTEATHDFRFMDANGQSVAFPLKLVVDHQVIRRLLANSFEAPDPAEQRNARSIPHANAPDRVYPGDTGRSH